MSRLVSQNLGLGREREPLEVIGCSHIASRQAGSGEFRLPELVAGKDFAQERRQFGRLALFQIRAGQNVGCRLSVAHGQFNNWKRNCRNTQ
jgi:hypothetical protein